MALGAQRDRLLQLMLFDGLRLRPALFGLGLGLLLSFAATRTFQSMLSGTRKSTDSIKCELDCG
jgi:macrolide transport system ATP-binding/permease protein